jgi:HEAT repeat protein
MNLDLNRAREAAEIVDSVRRGLSSADYWNAVGRLGALLPQLNADYIVRLLQDDDERIQGATVHGLGVREDGVKSSELVRPLLSIAARHADDDVRESALRELGKYREPEIFALLKQLEREGEGERGPRPIRHLVAEQLGGYDSEEAVDLLIKLLDDPDAYVQTLAIKSLAGVNRPRLAKLWLRLAQDWGDTGTEEVARSAVESLHAMPAEDGAADTLVAEMVSRAEEMLTSSASTDRAEGLRRLMYLRPETLGDRLLACLNDSSSTVRAAAALGLGIVHDSRAPEHLKRLVQSDVCDRVRGNAIYGLNKFHAPETLRFFLDDVWRSDDKSPEVRCALALSLPEYDSEEVVDALLNLLQDANWAVHNAAADSLLILNRPRLRPTWDALASESSAAAETAREALEALNASHQGRREGS